MTGADVRASDRDRDDAAAALGAHWTEGRIDAEELDRRVAAVYAARTRRELDVVLRDLPAAAAPAPAARAASARPPEPTRRRRRLFMPGVMSFQEQVDVAGSPEVAFDEALRTIAPPLGRFGYHLIGTERPRLMRFAARTAPDWAPAAAILTLGIGLLAYALRVERPLTVLFLPSGTGGTRVVAYGEAPASVRRAFAELRD